MFCVELEPVGAALFLIGLQGCTVCDFRLCYVAKQKSLVTAKCHTWVFNDQSSLEKQRIYNIVMWVTEPHQAT